jgi:predicted DNA-binding protein YlxM (UPF0122 family)
MKKVVFTDKQIIEITNDYLCNKLSCKTIGKKFNVSKTPINNLLKEKGLLKKGFSSGKKIELNDKQMSLIKKLYLEEKRTGPYIAKILNLNKHLIDKILCNSEFRRSVGESISLRQTGKKRSERVINILKTAQQNYSKSGKRKQTGGVCKKYIVNGIECQGTYEKFYIEKLIKEEQILPSNSISFETPFGVYYPDFSFNNKLIEIKSDYTYEVLLGNQINRYTKKIDKTQYRKIKWVNKNIKPVEIIIVDKRKNKLIKKETE